MCLAILKIKNILDYYIKSIENIEIPDVYALFQTFGPDIMGREIIEFKDADKNKEYFNKAVIHKNEKEYIGKPKKGFYAQTILKDFEEFRTVVIKGIGNNSNEENIQLVNIIIKKFGIKDFAMDCFEYHKTPFRHEIGKKGIMLMEINEMHLSTIDKKQLDFVYERLL